MHTKPKVFIEDISVTTELVDDVGIINYSIEISDFEETDIPLCQVNLLDANNQCVISSPQLETQGTFQVESPKLWWPIFMSENPGYLYTFEVN